MSKIANIRGAIARISCRPMLSVAIPRVKRLDAGIRYYDIGMGSTSAMEDVCQMIHSFKLRQGSTTDLFSFKI